MISSQNTVFFKLNFLTYKYDCTYWQSICFNIYLYLHFRPCIFKVNKKQKNALIIQCIVTQYSPTCFGTLKFHHQGVKHDLAEIDAQCRGKQRSMGAVYYNRRRDVRYIQTITLPTTLGTYLRNIIFDSLMMEF
jgi:hypothetical protein